MRPIELTPRLMALARQVPSGARFADVGTDHARLPVWLLEQGIIQSAIAVDLREGPLDKARRTAARHNLTDHISFRLGDGLALLAPEEADVIAIAGMGGETIASILDAAPWIRREGLLLLLQPMTSVDALRRWLGEHNWCIQEVLVKEGETIYVVLTVRFGPMLPQSPGALWVGQREQGRHDPLWGEYVALMTTRADKALEGLRRSTRPRDMSKRAELEALCAELRTMREERKMMTSVKKIYHLLDHMAPFEHQMDFDNAGFLVGQWSGEVSKVLIALDITLPVIEEAVQLGAQLILSHHPVIFHPAKTVTDRDVEGQKLRALVQHNISVICAHTNLDVVQGGVNDALAKALGLNCPVFLRTLGEDGPYPVKYGLGRVGSLENTMEPMAFASMVKEQLGAQAMRVVLGDRPIASVAVGGGACGDMLREAVAWNCDAFVTGDVKYDQFLDAAALGITLIDAGHFATENLVCAVLQDWLTNNFPEVEVMVSAVHKEVYFSL